MFATRYPLLLSVVLTGLGCHIGSSDSAIPRTGEWHWILQLPDRELPFSLELQRMDSSTWVALIHNASEEIQVNEVELRQDTLVLRMPLFDSEFRGVVRNDSTIEGSWYNHLKGPDYQIPFRATAGAQPRFRGPANGVGGFSGTWEVHFSSGTKDAYPAIGMFQQQPNGGVTGTFVTETGDYRFLEGTVHADSMQLSCFDGSHAFLFAAKLHADSMVGRFWSGSHWQEPWVAYRNPTFALRDPDSLTFLKEGYDMADFSMPGLDGRPLSPRDPEFKNKVLLVQVMGSWCPNCVDETRLLNDLYGSYAEQGLEVIALAFEKYPDPQKAVDALKRFKKNLGIQYHLAYAGMASKELAAAQLPFLERVMSFPTCVFVDRRGKVRRIRTGFYGPGTGQHYLNYTRNVRTFIEQLLAEPEPALATI